MHDAKSHDERLQDVIDGLIFVERDYDRIQQRPLAEVRRELAAARLDPDRLVERIERRTGTVQEYVSKHVREDFVNPPTIRRRLRMCIVMGGLPTAIGLIVWAC